MNMRGRCRSARKVIGYLIFSLGLAGTNYQFSNNPIFLSPLRNVPPALDEHNNFDVNRVADYESLSQRGAELFYEKAIGALRNNKRETFVVVLSGGRTPARTYEIINARKDLLTTEEWQKVYFFLGDEWMNKHNFAMVSNTLLTDLPVPSQNIAPIIPAHLGSQEAIYQAEGLAESYERRLKQIIEINNGKVDLLFLGVGGEDYGEGHVLSLFPGHSVMDDDAEWGVRVVDTIDLRRITLNKTVVGKTEDVVLLASGESKAHALQLLMEAPLNIKDIPAQILRLHPDSQRVHIIADESALSKIGGQTKSVQPVVPHYRKDSILISKRGYRQNIVRLHPSSNGAVSHTQGHRHPGEHYEMHYVVSGEAVYILQKQDADDPDIIETHRIDLKEGEWVVIPPGYGHTTYNPTSEEAVIVNYVKADVEYDYETFEQKGGASYLPRYREGQLQFDVNPQYRRVAALKTTTSLELLKNVITATKLPTGVVEQLKEWSEFFGLEEEFDEILSEVEEERKDTLPYVIVIDIGGTNFRIGIVTPEGKLLERPRQFESPSFIKYPDMPIGDLQQLLIETIVEQVQQLKRDNPDIPLNRVGISFPGPVDRKGKVLNAATIWNDAPPYDLTEALKERYSEVDWFVTNDLSAAIHRYGAMPRFRTFRKIGIITVSSGIGSKFFDIEHQELDLDKDGKSGEIGHFRVDFSEDALECDCGAKGHLSAISSGRGNERFARKMAAGDWQEDYGSSLIFAMTGGNPEAITTYHLVEAAGKNDTFALRVLEHTTGLLAYQMAMLIQSTPVERFVIVGGFALAVGERYVEMLREHLVKIGIFGRSEEEIRSMVVLGEETGDDGLIGTGLYVQKRFEKQGGVIEVVDDQGNKGFELKTNRDISYQVVTVPELFKPDNGKIREYYSDTEGNITKKALVVIEEKVYQLYGKMIEQYFMGNNIKYRIMIFPGGEENKNVSYVMKINEAMREFGVERREPVIAIGGGIVMDVVGLAAQLYRRGIPYIRIPTTLLGFVDAGIGIKVGVNLGGDKNRLGSFYPPLVSFNEPSFLTTLPEREMRAGLSEMVKMGVILDKTLFKVLEENYEVFLQREFSKAGGWQVAIDLSILRMLEQLQENLYEEGLKRLVDFGHTFSPKIEMASHNVIIHGEAVAIDMAITAEIAYLKGMLSAEERDRIINLLMDIGLPIYDPVCTVETLWESAKDAIKHRGGALNLPIPVRVGQATFLEDPESLSREILARAIDFVRDRSSQPLEDGRSILSAL